MRDMDRLCKDCADGESCLEICHNCIEDDSKPNWISMKKTTTINGVAEEEMKNCSNCGRGDKCTTVVCQIGFTGWIPMNERMYFTKLNNLTPTVESCTMKLIEELGELLQVIGKNNQASGEQHSMNTSPERLIGEAFDVAQSAVTMIYTVADKWGIDIEMQQELHEKKLKMRGYLK